MRANVDCSERAVTALEARLEAAVARAGRRALIVGQSRGGSMGRVLAVRRPDLVETLVTLGSPVLDQFAVNPVVHGQVRVLAWLGSLGVPGLFQGTCLDGPCCQRARRDLVAPVPESVRRIAFYSRNDEVVEWRACLDPGASLVEVTTTHAGMGVDVALWRRMAALLADEDPRPIKDEVHTLKM